MTPFNPRILSLPTLAAWREEGRRLGLDRVATESLLAQATFRAIRLESLPLELGQALLQELRALGGEGALGPSAPAGGVQALLLGTLHQVRALVKRLRDRGSPARHVAAALEEALTHYTGEALGSTRCGKALLEWGRRTYIMGVINVTPDSFSGDGVACDVEGVLERARRFVAEGADIIDIGGESTRPGHTPISAEEELRRVRPVIERLAAALEVPISIDTYKAGVAAQALAAGAVMVNDIWGLGADPEMAQVVAEHGVPVVIMHNQHGTLYRDLMADSIRTLREGIDTALAAGVRWENIIVDPGIGFGKTKDHNLEAIARLSELKVLGRPILIGTSRKSVIGLVLGLPVDQRLEGTAATVALAIANGADIVRVHDVREMARVARMTDAVVRGPWHASS